MVVDLLGQVGRTADSIGTSMENIDSKSVWLVIARALRLLIGECLVFSIGLASQTTGRPMDLPPEVSSRLAPGVSALKSGDLDTAQSIFASALRQGIKHPLVFHNLGVIEQQRGNHQRAIARFREALALQPDYAPSHLLLGSSLLALGRNVETSKLCASSSAPPRLCRNSRKLTFSWPKHTRLPITGLPPYKNGSVLSNSLPLNLNMRTSQEGRGRSSRSGRIAGSSV